MVTLNSACRNLEVAITAPPRSEEARGSGSVRVNGFALVRVIDMDAAAVTPQEVQLCAEQAALRVWIPENDSKCTVWHVRYS